MDIDVASMVGAVVREVASREHEGKMARVVVASRTYDTSREDLWDALTNAERIPRWFLPVSGDLRLGGRYQLEGNAGGAITRCESPSRLAVTWEFGGGVSWVNVSLTERPGGAAHLELEHIAHPSDHWDQFGPGAVGIGWDLSLIGLALHMKTGMAVDPTQFAAWSASDDGKAFMRASGEGWCAADIASGEDAETARAAAARTVGFYTGEATA